VPASPASQADGDDDDDVWLAYLDGNHYRATRLLDGYAEAVCPSGAVPKTLAELVEAAWRSQSGQKRKQPEAGGGPPCKKPRARPRPPPPTASPPQEEAGKKRAHADDANERRPRPPAKRRDYGESWAGDDHGEWKDAMNDVFGEGVRRLTQEHGSGLVLVLDDDNEPAGGGFGSSRCLHERFGVPVEALRIVQNDGAKAERMQAGGVYGPRVVHGSVQEHLQASGERYRALYLDLCGTWNSQLGPSLDALFGQADALPADGSPLLLGVTWGTREPSGLTEEESVSALYSTLMQHASVTELRVSKFRGMRTRFYELTRKRV
jgi:hypothetical protein